MPLGRNASVPSFGSGLISPPPSQVPESSGPIAPNLRHFIATKPDMMPTIWYQKQRQELHQCSRIVDFQFSADHLRLPPACSRRALATFQMRRSPRTSAPDRSGSIVEMRGICDASAVVAVPRGEFDVFLVANDENEQLEAHKPDGTKLNAGNGNLRSLLRFRG